MVERGFDGKTTWHKREESGRTEGADEQSMVNLIADLHRKRLFPVPTLRKSFIK